MTKYQCAACGESRRPINLLRVTDRKTGEARYVCRPTFEPRCFTLNVRPRSADRIEAAA